MQQEVRQQEVRQQEVKQQEPGAIRLGVLAQLSRSYIFTLPRLHELYVSTIGK